MEQERITKVIFRKFKDGEIIALFPENPGTNDANTCESYMHIGQHGTAIDTLADITAPCNDEEVKPLWGELEDMGYNLKRVKIMHRSYWKKRHDEINRITTKYSHNKKDEIHA